MDKQRRTLLFVLFLVIKECICEKTTDLTDKCSYDQFTPLHTLCIFEGPNAECKINDRGVSYAEVKTILTLHNTYRSIVSIGATAQPRASNMKMMHWDLELAKVAQRWSEQCFGAHDCNRCRQVSRFFVGQNIYLEEFKSDFLMPKWGKVIGKWYKQIKNFDETIVTEYKYTNITGDYSQLAWAETTNIGCGYTEFTADKKNFRFYVCNYGPAGNVIGEKVYNIGDACTMCNGHCSAKYLGLCDTKAEKSPRMLKFHKVVKHHTILGTCDKYSNLTCLISHIGPVKWTSIVGHSLEGVGKMADIHEGASTDLIIKIPIISSSYSEACVTFWYQKYASDPSYENRPAKIYYLTSEDQIRSIELHQDSKHWKEVTNTINITSHINKLTLMVHFNLKKDGKNHWKWNYDPKAERHVTIKIGNVEILGGKC